MLLDKTLLKISIDKENECYIKIDPSTYAKLTEAERRVIRCHILQAMELLKEKYLDKGNNIWRE